MYGANHSVVSEFVFLGITHSWEIQLLLFVFSSVFYMASIMGNSLIILTVTSDPHLHSPMYFLLANLSFIDMGVSSVSSPKMIYDLFRKHKVISFSGCIAQIFFIHVIGGVEMVLLIAMAFDRYIAICKPLYYLTIMSPRMCVFFLVAAWMIGLIHSMVQLAFVVNLPFCGPNVLDSFYCDLPRFIKLACIDTYQPTVHGHSQQWIHLCWLLLHSDHFLHYHHSHCSETVFSGFIQGSVHTFSSHHCSSLVLWSFDIFLHVAISLYTPG